MTFTATWRYRLNESTSSRWQRNSSAGGSYSRARSCYARCATNARRCSGGGPREYDSPNPAGRITTKRLLATTVLLVAKLLACSVGVLPSLEGQSLPLVTLNPPAAGASQLSGQAYNVDTSTTKVVIYALTNEWYVQPFAAAPFTGIASNGSWTSFTNSWSSLVVLLVDPADYTPAATEITNPALDPGVLAWTEYPSGPATVNFSGRTWGIKVSGSAPSDQFDPGPNFWSNDPSVVSVADDGLHLKITQINGMWQCAEVYLLGSLGYGTYTVQVGSHLDNLDRNTVAAPLFIYAAPGQELDNEYSGTGGLISSPNNAQFVAQPYTIPGNIMFYQQPSTAQFTSQMEWAADHVTFTAWNGWSSTPAPTDIIYQWTYTGAYLPPVGQERFVINLWLLYGCAPLSGTGNEMVINSFSFQPPPLGFVPVVPCRVVDTRDSTKPSGFGQPFISGGTSRAFAIPNGPCNIPATAEAYSVNVTVVPHGDLGYLTVWPTAGNQPIVSTLNSLDGRVKANAAIVTGAPASVFATNDTDVVLDINGYFVSNTNAAALAFYPMTPCRLVDTRPGAQSTIITGRLAAGMVTTLPILSSSCNVPATAQTYSLNFTVVPPAAVGYLTVWPTGESQPIVSTLNDPTGTGEANAAIVSAGAGGSIDVFLTDATDLVVDIDGYFAPMAPGGLSLYGLPPCRVLDTRNPAGAPPFEGAVNINVQASGCGGFSTAQAYVFNATVVPNGPLGFLTLWPQGSAQPVVSTLNALDGAVTSNMAIVPTSNTQISAFASNSTYLILDLSGYFAP